jgi:hypothetical protein
MLKQAGLISLRFNESRCSHISAFPFWPGDVSARVFCMDVVLHLVYLFQQGVIGLKTNVIRRILSL